MASANAHLSERVSRTGKALDQTSATQGQQMGCQWAENIKDMIMRNSTKFLIATVLPGLMATTRIERRRYSTVLLDSLQVWRMRKTGIALAAILVAAMPMAALAGDKGMTLGGGGVLWGASSDSISTRAVKFVMQSDCNLVAYRGSSAVWSSKTHGKGSNCRAVMQTDGNLVVYRSDNKAVWSSNTFKYPGGKLVAQHDGNVVIYQNNKARWATNTVLPKAPGGNAATGPGGPFQGCHYAKTQTKCVIVTQWHKEVYHCGWNASNMTPIEKSTDWSIAGACFGWSG